MAAFSLSSDILISIGSWISAIKIFFHLRGESEEKNERVLRPTMCQTLYYLIFLLTKAPRVR